MKNSKKDIITMSIEALDNIKYNSRYNSSDLNNIILLIDVANVLDKARTHAESYGDIKTIGIAKNNAYNSIENISITSSKYSEEAVLYTDEFNTLITNNNIFIQL